jgi:hypothetical protein
MPNNNLLGIESGCDMDIDLMNAKYLTELERLYTILLQKYQDLVDQHKQTKKTIISLKKILKENNIQF